ncbi:hypothetical protein V5799_003209 [Amblyomma americanum]|uniref:Uncharacterized protein n=1 Tax=Amblyomma americanum TaxID=6943 RepID=A0AAQ4D9M2_AMBAM
MLPGVAEAKQPGSKPVAPKDSEEAPADAKPFPVSVSRPNAPLPCKAGLECKRLLRKTSERDRLQAVQKRGNEVGCDNVPLDGCGDESSNNMKSDLSSGASGPQHSPHKKRCRAVLLEDYDDVSDTPLEEYSGDVPGKHACHSASLSKVTHGKATATAPRPADEPKLKGSAGQGEHSNKGHHLSLNKDEKQRHPETFKSARPEKLMSSATVEPQPNGTKACAVTTTKPNSKSSLALATGKNVIEKALKRPGTPCKNEGAKVVKLDLGTENSTAKSCVSTVKKSSSQSSSMNVPPNKSVRCQCPVSHANKGPKKHAATSDNHCATKEAPGLKSTAGTIPGKVGIAGDDIHKARGDSSLSVAKKALPDKLLKKPQSSARGSSHMSASNLSVSEKCLPVSTQKTTNDRPETKAGSTTGHHKAGSSATKNALPSRLAQKPELCIKSSSASNQSDSAQPVPSSSSKTGKDAEQSKSGCGPNTTQHNTSPSVTKKVLPKIPKKPVSSDMSAKSDASTSKQGGPSKAPTSTPKCVKHAGKPKAVCSCGTDLQDNGPAVSKQAPPPNKMVKRPVPCTKSSDISASKPSHVSISKKILTFSSKGDKGPVPSIPATKPAPCMNSNASKAASTPEKTAKMDKAFQSDLQTKHKKCSDGHSGTFEKEQVADNTAARGDKTKQGCKPNKVTAGKQFKSTAPDTCAATVEVKISRSKLTSHPNTLTPSASLVSSAESQMSEQTKQQPSKLPKRVASLEQTDCSVGSFPESGSSLPKACDVNLPNGRQASVPPEETTQAEATVPDSCERICGTTEMPTEGTTCLEKEAQASEQPVRNVADSITESALGSNGCTPKNTGTSQNTCTSKMWEPSTEVRKVVADIVVEVAKNLTDLADIGAEVECSNDSVHENRVTIRLEDQVSLPQDSSNMTDVLATSAETNAGCSSRPEFPTNANKHTLLDHASEELNKDATDLFCKLDDMKSEQQVSLASGSTVALTSKQTSILSKEKEQCSISLEDGPASEMSPTTGDCDKANNALPESSCFQDPTGKEDPASNDHFSAATHSGRSALSPDEQSHRESLTLSSQRAGSRATTVMEEIRDSESISVCEDNRVDEAAVSQELIASESAVNTVRSNNASTCESNDDSNCQVERDSVNDALQGEDTDNTDVSISQKLVGGEAPDETNDNGSNACVADKSSEQQAKQLGTGVSHGTEGDDTSEAMDVDNSVPNESIHSQMDEPRSLPEEFQKHSGTAPSRNGVCDLNSSTETSDTLSLPSDDSVASASQPSIIAEGVPKTSSSSKKRKRNRSAGTNTSLCSSWVFSRSKRGKRRRKDKQHGKSSAENSSTSALASELPEAVATNTSTAEGVLTQDVHKPIAIPQIKQEPPVVNTCKMISDVTVLPEAAATNTSTVEGVLTQGIHRLEAVPQIKQEPPAVNTCKTLISSDVRNPPCASAVHPGSARDPRTILYKKPLTPSPAAPPHATTSSSVEAALLELDMYTGLSILDVCGSASVVYLKELTAQVMNHTITKNDALNEIARSVRNTVVEEYFKGQRAVKTLNLLSKIPFSFEPTKVPKIRKLTQAVVEKYE